MGRREFPALGFDPAPGDAGAVEAAARHVDVAARTFGRAAGDLARLNSSTWTGEAAESFRGQLKDLPRDVDLAAQAHQTAARTLTNYGTDLLIRQRRADELESRAEELRRRQHAAIAEVNRVAAQRAPAGSPELAALRVHYRAAKSRADILGSELQQVVADARRLYGEHRTAAQSAALLIRGASEAPYREPGRLARALSAVKKWIADHADVLADISTVLKGVSAVLGVLSLVPGLQFLAPFAIAAGALALALDVAVKAATGRGSWASLTLDAALTVVPFGPVARAVKSVPGVANGLKAVNRAIPDTVKGKLFRAVGNLPEGLTRTQLDAAATRIRAQAGHYGDDVIVQGSRAGHSARPGSDVDFGIRVDPVDFDHIITKRFGAPNPNSSKERTMLHAIATGKIHAGEAGMHGLRVQLRRDLRMRVDLSVIRRGGPYDTEPWLKI